MLMPTCYHTLIGSQVHIDWPSAPPTYFTIWSQTEKKLIYNKPTKSHRLAPKLKSIQLPNRHCRYGKWISSQKASVKRIKQISNICVRTTSFHIFWCCCWNVGERCKYWCVLSHHCTIWPGFGLQGLNRICCWMLMTKVLSSPQEVSLSLLPITTKCSVVLVEERSKTQLTTNQIEIQEFDLPICHNLAM